jgi:hypothetical protein
MARLVKEGIPTAPAALPETGRGPVAGSRASLTAPAGDGYAAESPLAEVRGCADCMVSFGEDAGFRMVVPAFPGNA